MLQDKKDSFIMGQYLWCKLVFFFFNNRHHAYNFPEYDSADVPLITYYAGGNFQAVIMSRSTSIFISKIILY